MLASRLGRAWLLRLVVALAGCAVSLFATGVAQAAIAGGNPATTSQLPDLRSAIATSSSDVQVCFDKPLSQSSAVISKPYAIYLDGYASNDNYLDPVAASIDPKNGDCVDLVFDARGGQLDLGQFTVATVDYGAVETTGGQVNLADSTTLLSSTTHNGTAGLTNAPDLVGPAVQAFSSSTPNTVEYVFDQNVDPSNIDPTDFFIEDATGAYCYGQGGNVTAFGNTVPAVSYSGNDVYVTYAYTSGTTASSCDVANARRAGVLAHGVSDVSSDEIYNPLQGTSVPSNAGTTSDADLVSAVLDSSGNQVTYTFDKPVNAGTASDFFVAFSNGDVMDGTSTSTASPDAITVTFNGGTFDTNLANYDEYAVQAGIDNGAAATTSNGSSNPASLGAVPIGGNSGAFARGFTTGPDAYAASINTTQDVATIDFDQRVAYYDFDQTTSNSSVISNDAQYIVEFLNSQGAVLGPPSSIIIPAFPNPGPQAITMDVDHALISQGIAAIALDPAGNGSFGTPDFYGSNGECAFDTALTYAESPDNGCSVPQIIAPTVTSAHIRGLRPVRADHRGARRHKARKADKARRTRRARRARRARRRG